MDCLTAPKMSPNLFFPDHLALLKMSLCVIDKPHAKCTSLPLSTMVFSPVLSSSVFRSSFSVNFLYTKPFIIWYLSLSQFVPLIPATPDPIFLAAPGSTVYNSENGMEKMGFVKYYVNNIFDKYRIMSFH